MPAKMGTCCKQKGVLVTVYVEKPKRRTFSNQNHHHHRHHHNHHHIRHTIKREVIHYRQGAAGKGHMSRRAELLQYSQYLRQSARSAPSSTHSSRPNNSSNSQQPHAQIVAVRRKPNKNSKAPACFGNWKFPYVFGFFTSSQPKKEKKARKNRSGKTTNDKIKAAIKRFKVKKQQGLFSKVFTTSTKRK